MNLNLNSLSLFIKSVLHVLMKVVVELRATAINFTLSYLLSRFIKSEGVKNFQNKYFLLIKKFLQLLNESLWPKASSDIEKFSFSLQRRIQIESSIWQAQKTSTQLRLSRNNNLTMEMKMKKLRTSIMEE